MYRQNFLMIQILKLLKKLFQKQEVALKSESNTKTKEGS